MWFFHGLCVTDYPTANPQLYSLRSLGFTK
jgi:hypothetical protein